MERYRVLAAIDVKSENTHEDLDRSPFVARDGSVPVSLGSYGDIPYIKIISEKTGKTIPGRKKVSCRYKEIGSEHGRNMTEVATSKTLVWGGDLPGDIYGSVSIKGGKVGSARIEHGFNCDYGYRGYGLMDDASVDRVIQASYALRSLGLPTEKPVVVSLIKEMPVKGSIDKKSWFLKKINHWKADQALNRKQSEMEEISKYLSETDFIVVERHMQVDERICDMHPVNSTKALQDFYGPIFKWLNTAVKYRNGGLISGTPSPEVFVVKEQSVFRYLVQYLPSQMGIYMGRMHKNGIVHGFPHKQNWTVVGTLCDLDSVWGKKVFGGDKKPHQGKYMKDIQETLPVFVRLMGVARDIVRFDINEIHADIERSFIENYVKERFGVVNKVTLKFFETEFKLFSHTDNQISKRVWSRLYKAKN